MGAEAAVEAELAAGDEEAGGEQGVGGGKHAEERAAREHRGSEREVQRSVAAAAEGVPFGLAGPGFKTGEGEAGFGGEGAVAGAAVSVAGAGGEVGSVLGGGDEQPAIVDEVVE